LVGRKYLDEAYAVHTVLDTELEAPLVAVCFNYEQKSQISSSSLV